MVVHDVANPVFAEIISGAQAAAKKHGYSLLLGDADALGPGATRMTNLIRGGGIRRQLIPASISEDHSGYCPTTCISRAK